MNIKNTILLTSVLITVLVLNTFSSKENAKEKLGAVLSLSGTTSSFYGEYTKNAVDLAVEQFNDEGGINGKKVVVEYQNSAADKKTGLSAGQKLIQDGYKIIITDVTAVSLALAPVLQENKIVHVATITSSPHLTTMGDYIFRTKYSAALEGKSSVNYILNTLKPKRIAFIYQNSDYGKGVFGAFGDELEKYNSNIVSSDSYEIAATDVRTTLAKIKSSNPDAIILAGFPKEIGLILKQAGEMNINAQFIAHSGSVGPDIVKIAGKSADGLIYLTELDRSTNEFKVFASGYKEKYGTEPELVSSSSYDATKLILQAGKECGTLQNPDCIKDNLAKVRNYNGVSGLITFDENGDISDRGMTCLRKEVKNNTGTLIEKDNLCI